MFAASADPIGTLRVCVRVPGVYRRPYDSMACMSEGERKGKGTEMGL